MNVSIINVNWIHADAIGQTISKQVEFFLRRGDNVRVYTLSEAQGVAAQLTWVNRVTTLDQLQQGSEPFFPQSDLFIFHYPGRHPLIDAMLTLKRGSVIFFYHNVTPPEMWPHEEERQHLHYSLQSLPMLLAHADLIVTPSEFNAQSLIDEHGADPSRLRVLPLSVELDRFAPRSAPTPLVAQHGTAGRCVLLFVGRVASNKRIDLLIDAVALLAPRHPELLLLVVGEGDDNESQRQIMADLRERVAAQGMTDHVSFVGKVDDVAPYFNLADLYVTASLHEGFGVPLIEAMASGLPIVASDATAHPLVVGDAALLVEAERSAALAEGIATLIAAPEQRHALAQRGLDRVQRYAESEVDLRWSQIVAEASSWLPEQLFPRNSRLKDFVEPVTPSVTDSRQAHGPPPALPTPWQQLLDQLAQQGATMDRSYQVRSSIPLVATVRRHLTSHLHEPFVNPTFDRQEQWNRAIVALLRQLVLETPFLDREAALPAETLQALQERLDRLYSSGVPMDRGYEVRSAIPLVAPIRRHLTSHLHQPYIDPTFERQSAFNQSVVELLQHLLAERQPTPEEKENVALKQALQQQAALQCEIDGLWTRLGELDQRTMVDSTLQKRLETVEMATELLMQQVTLLIAEQNGKQSALLDSLQATTVKLQQSVAALQMEQS
ncbi:MAG: glycosyltransferase family 4 protein [Anaerolineales bacterium]|nr:glycosyltransferase family 4 protein [Anaerolineales bacterium]